MAVQRLLAGMLALPLLLLPAASGCRKPQAKAPIPAARPATTRAVASTRPVPVVTPHAVDIALKRGAAYLLANRRGGVWERDIGLEVARGQPLPPDFGEQTALVTHALLATGESTLTSSELALAAEWLSRRNLDELTSTRAIAGRLRVSLGLPPGSADRQALRHDAMLLLNRARVRGAGAGLYAAELNGTKATLEASADAALALVEAAEHGEAQVPPGFWQAAHDAWHRMLPAVIRQTEAVKGAAGVIPLARATEALLAVDDSRDVRVDCNPLPPDGALEGAIARLSEGYQRIYEGPGVFEAIGQFARTMRALGRKYVGGSDGGRDTHDWYTEATAFVLASQRADGSWGDGFADTARALRFLAESRAPLIAQKLAYDLDHGPVGRQPGPWNNRPRDLARLARWMGRQSGRPLDWRVTRGDAPVEDWLEAPILVVSGNQGLDLSPETKRKLAEYVRRGGLVVGNADCSSAEFTTTFRAIAQELSPQHAFRELPVTHPLLRGLGAAGARTSPQQVSGIADGPRELMLLLPDDAAKEWARGTPTAAGPARPSVALAQNLVRYASAGGLRAKDELVRETPGSVVVVAADLARQWRPEVQPPFRPVELGEITKEAFVPWPPPVKPTPTKDVTLAMVAGAFNPAAPAPFASLRQSLLRRDTRLLVDSVALGQWTLQRYDVAWTTGARFLRLSALQRMEVRRFLETGGRLVVEVSDVPAPAVDAVEWHLASLFDAPRRLNFGMAVATDVGIPFRARVWAGRLEGRPAVFVATDRASAESLLEALLAGRAKDVGFSARTMAR